MHHPLMAMLLLSVAVASAVHMPPQGVWRGTIGTKAIMACFNEESPSTSYASYYYVDYLRPISLTTRNTDSFWHEGNDTGLWKLSVPANSAIVGTWSSPKTRRTLPIKLDYIDGSEDKAACAQDSYNSRLETAPSVEETKMAQFSLGRSYRKLRFAGQETIKLYGSDPALDQINSFLKLDKSKEAIDSYFKQRREYLARVGSPTTDERYTEPVYWDANFVTVRFYTWAAGKGRSGISNEYRTWNTRTGKEIDLWQWIGASSSDPRLPSRLKKHLYKNVRESPGCTNGYRGQGSFTLTLAKSGLNIDEEDWGNGCEKSFFISYKKLLPFLSPSGKQALSSKIGQK
jgi:hypothetical protein